MFDNLFFIFTSIATQTIAELFICPFVLVGEGDALKSELLSEYVLSNADIARVIIVGNVVATAPAIQRETTTSTTTTKVTTFCAVFFFCE
jgi:hypothetical protein